VLSSFIGHRTRLRVRRRARQLSSAGTAPKTGQHGTAATKASRGSHHSWWRLPGAGRAAAGTGTCPRYSTPEHLTEPGRARHRRLGCGPKTPSIGREVIW